MSPPSSSAARAYLTQPRPLNLSPGLARGPSFSRTRLAGPRATAKLPPISTRHSTATAARFTVIEVLATQGNQERIIGGYNPQSWNSIGDYTTTPNDADRTAFLFNLTTTTQQKQKLGTGDSNAGLNQTYGRIDYGPTFGGGHDLFMSPNLATGYVRQHSYGPAGSYGINIMDGTNLTPLDTGTMENLHDHRCTRHSPFQQQCE